MHVPAFLPEHRLSDWSDCTLEITCVCGRTTCPSVRLVRERHGDIRFSQLAAKLRCAGCGKKPAPVYVVAGHHRDAVGGGPPDWAVLLVRAVATPGSTTPGH